MFYLPTAPLPSVLYLSLLLSGQPVYLFIDEPFQKQSYRNRFDIGEASGRRRLSIPVEQYGNPAPPTALISISEHGNWRHVAEQAIRSAYSASPFYEYYEDEVLELLYNPCTRLADYNEAWLDFFCKQWQLPRVICFPEDEVSIHGRHMQQLCSRHLNQQLPIQMPVYYQLFAERNGFLPNLSALDLLCHLGPEGFFVLKETARRWALRGYAL